MTDQPKIPPAARIGPNGETAIELAQAGVKQMCAALGIRPEDVPTDLGPLATQSPAAADPIDLPPAMQGEFGRAWLIPRDAMTDPLATLCAWIVEAEWANCAWHSYVVALIHLRPLPGVPPAKIRVPAATHEFLVFALNPAHPRQPGIERGEFRYLTPANFVAQIVAEHDAAAVERIEAAVQEICDGTLNPDSDSRRQWVARFGDDGVRK